MPGTHIARVRILLPRLAVVLLAAACGGERGERRRGEDAPHSAADSAARSPTLAQAGASALEDLAAGAEPAPQDTTPFEGTTEAIHQARSAPPVRVLGAVRAAAHPGYDRIVFEFTGDDRSGVPGVPGYHIEYSERPARECGSGNEVTLAGAARLVVRLEPAQAHDDRGDVTIQERARAPRLPILNEMRLTCDFEGQVEWVLGLSARQPFRVREMANPPRLVLDLRHTP